MEFITSSKGSLKLLYQGCSYVKQKDLVNNLESCEIVNAYTDAKAILCIRDGESVDEVRDNTHQPNLLAQKHSNSYHQQLDY